MYIHLWAASSDLLPASRLVLPVDPESKTKPEKSRVGSHTDSTNTSSQPAIFSETDSSHIYRICHGPFSTSLVLLCIFAGSVQTISVQLIYKQILRLDGLMKSVGWWPEGSVHSCREFFHQSIVKWNVWNFKQLTTPRSCHIRPSYSPKIIFRDNFELDMRIKTTILSIPKSEPYWFHLHLPCNLEKVIFCLTFSSKSKQMKKNHIVFIFI